MTSKAPQDNWQAVYQEFYAEMRRYRDMEFHVGRWNTTILLAAIGALLALSQTPDLHLTWGIKVPLALGVGLAALANCFFIHYSGRRYSELRTQAHKIEPPWKQELIQIRPAPRYLSPLWSNIAVQLMLLSVFLAVLVQV